MPAEPYSLPTRPVLSVLAENWWLLLLRGLAAILFGLLTLIWPGVTLLTLVLLFGLYALFDGFTSLFAAVRGRHKSTPMWWLIVAGLVSVAAGIVTFIHPELTGLVLVLLIGAWALVRGVFEIVGAVRLRKELRGEWLLIAAGLLSVVFGVALLVNPEAGALALAWLIGAYALMLGFALIWLALRVRRRLSQPPRRG
ncbi:hypothetical protein Maes01_02699 [Microbulbifer aestuariivivens]|uniref:HdeD family acid-resistance protein n=1 Tax=Microbulbifer aestuariivivens TaxID=1908308 RepID=A0ABP9WVF3_9GAMM